MMHRLLARQLRKAFGDDPPPGLEPLLEQIDAAYVAADEDRALLERAMEIAGEELSDRNEELSARVAELEAAQQELAAADAWRRRFINATAHELSTPLTPIKLQIHMLEQQDDPRRLARGIHLMKRNVERLALLVGDLLDAAKIQSDHLALRIAPTDVAALARESTASMRPFAVERGVDLRCDADRPAEADVDAARTAQVLDNLLSNAIKFTPRGGHVEVSVACGDRVSVTVRDSGIGMDEEALSMLFRPFTRVHPHESDIPGTGLGLYVSSGIAQALGGTLTAASDGPGSGATFTLTLPASR